MVRHCVIKVGGSLYERPDLGPRLRRWLEALPAALLVPGGGATADVIRAFDRTHGLGEEAAHWLALRALSVNAHFLARLLPEAAVVTELLATPPRWCILDPYLFFHADEEQPGHLPHHWQVTSDSLAVRVAQQAGAPELVLLKAVSWDGLRPWEEAARAGIVDAYFPAALRQVPGLTVRLVNLRTTAS